MSTFSRLLKTINYTGLILLVLTHMINTSCATELLSKTAPWFEKNKCLTKINDTDKIYFEQSNIIIKDENIIISFICILKDNYDYIYLEYDDIRKDFKKTEIKTKDLGLIFKNQCSKSNNKYKLYIWKNDKSFTKNEKNSILSNEYMLLNDNYINNKPFFNSIDLKPNGLKLHKKKNGNIDKDKHFCDSVQYNKDGYAFVQWKDDDDSCIDDVYDPLNKNYSNSKGEKSLYGLKQKNDSDEKVTIDFDKKVTIDSCRYKFYPNFGFVKLNGSFLMEDRNIRDDQLFLLLLSQNMQMKISPISCEGNYCYFYNFNNYVFNNYVLLKTSEPISKNSQPILKNPQPIGILKQEQYNDKLKFGRINKGLFLDKKAANFLKKLYQIKQLYNSNKNDVLKIINDNLVLKNINDNLEKFFNNINLIKPKYMESFQKYFASYQKGPVFIINDSLYFEKELNNEWKIKNKYKIPSIDKKSTEYGRELYKTLWDEELNYKRTNIFDSDSYIYQIETKDITFKNIAFNSRSEDFIYPYNEEKYGTWIILDDYKDPNIIIAKNFHKFKTSETFKNIIINAEYLHLNHKKIFRLDQIQGPNIVKLSKFRKVINNSTYQNVAEFKSLLQLEPHDQQYESTNWELHLFVAESNRVFVDSLDIDSIINKFIDLNVKRLMIWEFSDYSYSNNTEYYKLYNRISEKSHNKLRIKYKKIDSDSNFNLVKIPYRK